LSQKLTQKAYAEHKHYISQIFSTDKGKALLTAIKNKVALYVDKGEKDKDKLGKKIIGKIISKFASFI